MSQLEPSLPLSPATPPKLNWVWDGGDGWAGWDWELHSDLRPAAGSAVKCSAVH